MKLGVLTNVIGETPLPEALSLIHISSAARAAPLFYRKRAGKGCGALLKKGILRNPGPAGLGGCPPGGQAGKGLFVLPGEHARQLWAANGGPHFE